MCATPSTLPCHRYHISPFRTHLPRQFTHSQNVIQRQRLHSDITVIVSNLFSSRSNQDLASAPSSWSNNYPKRLRSKGTCVSKRNTARTDHSSGVRTKK